MPNLTLKLNDKRNLQELLQQIYDESRRQLNEIQNAINGLENSTKLADETIDGKSKYAKAMHDFHNDKEKVIRLKLDVAKVMNDVMKLQGDVKPPNSTVIDTGEVDINALRRESKTSVKSATSTDDEIIEYKSNFKL